MGHPQSIEGEEFIDLGTELKYKRSKHICNHCKAVYDTKKCKRDDIIRRNEILATSHLSLKNPRSCQGVSRASKRILISVLTTRFVSARVVMVPSGVDGNSSAVARITAEHPRNEDMQSWSSDKRQRCDDGVFPGESEATELARMHRCLVECQADNLLPDAFIERPSTKRLLRQVQKMKGDIVALLPSHKQLGDYILDGYALRCEGEDSTILKDHQNSTGGRVNFLSDGWQNISKVQLMDYRLALFGREMTYDLLEVIVSYVNKPAAATSCQKPIRMWVNNCGCSHR